MTDFQVRVATNVELVLDAEGLKEEFPDVWEETVDLGGEEELFIEALIDLEGVDYLINSEWCLGHEEFSPDITVEKDE